MNRHEIVKKARRVLPERFQEAGVKLALEVTEEYRQQIAALERDLESERGGFSFRKGFYDLVTYISQAKQACGEWSWSGLPLADSITAIRRHFGEAVTQYDEPVHCAKFMVGREVRLKAAEGEPLLFGKVTGCRIDPKKGYLYTVEIKQTIIDRKAETTAEGYIVEDKIVEDRLGT